MQFAIPYIKTAGTPSGSLPNPKIQDDEENEPPEINQNASALSPTTSPLTSPPRCTTSPTYQTERSETPLSTSSRHSSSASLNQNYRRYKNKVSENDELFNKYIQTKMSKKNDDNESTNNTANKMFLLSLLPDLNSMTPIQVRSFKRQALDLIDNMLNIPSEHVEYINDDELNETTYIQLLENSVDEINYIENE